jgi:hypothetical protein
MKALETLVKAEGNRTIGNHTVQRCPDRTSYVSGRDRTGRYIWKKAEGFNRDFQYHGNTICLVDDVKKKMILTHAGWYTRSTSRALNDYRAYFLAAGYQIVEEH